MNKEDREELYIEARRVPIDEYMRRRGFEMTNNLRLKFCSSPFSNDSEASFCFYERSNSFYCFSTGQGGDIIRLASLMDGVSYTTAAISLVGESNFSLYDKGFEKRKIDKDVFNLEDYLLLNDGNKQENSFTIRRYAKSRKIEDKIELCRFYSYDEGRFVQHLAMGFLHVNLNLKPCGIKMRNAAKVSEPKNRFRAKGELMFYILENVIKDSFDLPTIFIVEGEANANSLWMHLREEKINGIVISFGAVSNIPKRLPYKYDELKNINVIIDYDGSEELFNSRIRKYEHLKGEAIKLKLNKGEDMNSLYVSGKLKLIKLW